MKKRIISALIMLSILLSMSPVTVLGASASVGDIGRVRVSTMPLPSTVSEVGIGNYSASGKVLVAYKTENDINTLNYWNIAVSNDDGTGFRNIYSGLITPTSKGVNEHRIRPFKDNKRVLLGDYVLECTPNIDTCASSQLVPVEYPDFLKTNNSVTRLWTEIIIAPDNTHMSWTTLMGMSADSYYGTLTRGTDKYTISNVQRITAGEVKEFIHGGQAISHAGARPDNLSTDSMMTDLMTGDVTAITTTPGYDETTNFSPDGRLGLTMSDRFSKSTTAAIFGQFPIPHSTTLAPVLYSNVVRSVRAVREGSIGPVLVDIDRSMHEDGYMGINLNTDPNWVFWSPMSWSPDGKHAMFSENLRGTFERRIRIMNLLDYIPQTPVPTITLPDLIPAALPLTPTTPSSSASRIDGKKSGYITVSGNTKTYVNFSDDGVNFYEGYITSVMGLSSSAESVFEANLKLIGPKPGEMNLRATFGPSKGNQPNRFLYDMASDGKPKSYGYSTYNGVTLYMDDLKDNKVLIDDSFDKETVGAAPGSWTVSQPSGTAVSIANTNAPVVPVVGATPVTRSVYLKDNSTINYAQVSKSFASQTGAVIAQWNFMDGSDVAGNKFQLRSGNTVAASVYVDGSGNLTADGTVIQKVSPNTWYNIKLAANPATDKYDIYVGQHLKASGIAFTTPVTSLDNISFQTGAANQNSMYIDDVRVVWASNNLKGLTLSAGSLTPNFDPNVTSYTLSVNNYVSSTTVTASVYDPGATVKINDNPAATEVASEAIALGVGNTSIPIVVTAQDGSQKTYNIDVIRAPSSSGRSHHSSTSSANSSTTTPVPTAPPAPPTTPAPTATPAQSSPNMGDVKSHWAEAAINKLVSLGAISGYGDGSFKPNNNITRAEFITILVKAFKLEDKAGKTFTDTATHWAKDYISIATANGIADGYNDSAFGPDDLITREQMAVMICNILKLSGVSSDSQFSDESALSSWAKAPVEAAKKNGIIEGYPDGSFKPQANATRAEAVTIIVKALGLSK